MNALQGSGNLSVDRMQICENDLGQNFLTSLNQESCLSLNKKESLEVRTSKAALPCCVLVLGGHSRGESHNGFSASSLADFLSPKLRSCSDLSLNENSSLQREDKSRVLSMDINEIAHTTIFFIDEEVETFTFRERAYSSNSSKAENSPPSPFEIAVVAEKSGDNEVQNLIGLIRDLIQRDPEFNPRLSVRFLDEDEGKLQYVNPSGEVKFAPQREIDSIFVCGDPRVMSQYKEQTYTAIRNLCSTEVTQWKKTFLKQEVRNLKNLLHPDSNLKKMNGAIDLEEGNLYYNNMDLLSVKYPYLRVVQHFVLYAIIKGINSGLISRDAFFSMPHGTLDRIDWLSNNNFWDLEEESINQLKEGYNSGLEYYFRSQRAYVNMEEKTKELISGDLRCVGEKIYNITKELPPVKTASANERPAKSAGRTKVVVGTGG